MSNTSSPVLEKKRPLENNGLMDTSQTPANDENDPCLKTGNKKSGKFYERTEVTLREKTGLSRRGLIVSGIVLLVLLFLFITVVVLVICWPRTPHERQFPICEDAACLRAVSQIREGLNKSISPCEDVVEWGCGNWLRTHSIPLESNHWSQRAIMYRQELKWIHELISTLPQQMDHKSVKYKIKRFYDACMNVESVEADGVNTLLRRINELDGWHILREWNINDSDYRKVLERLQAIYGVTPFFKISVVPHPYTHNTNVIKIEPSGLGLIDKNMYYLDARHKAIEAYKQLVHDIVILFQASSKSGKTFGEDIFHFEKRLAEITPDTITIQDPVDLHNLISVSELKIQAISLPLESILQTMFPQGRITDDTEILVTSMDYLSSVSNLISNTERSALNDYFMWTFTREYLPYLSSKVLAELNVYITDITGIQKPMDRWELCIGITKKFMALGVESMLENARYVSDKDLLLLDDIFENVRTAAKAVVADMDLPEELNKHIKYKLTSMGLEIGIRPSILTDKYLSEYYDQLFIQKGNLFHSVLNGFEFLNYEKQKRYNNPKPEDRTLPYLIQDPPKVHYAPSANVIVIPKSFLQEPFFHSDYPRSVIYARLGQEIAKAFTESILPFGSTWRAEHNLLTKYHPAYNESLHSVVEPMHCLTNIINRENLTIYGVFNLTVLNTLKHITAVNIAHRALEISLVTLDHVHQPTLETYEDSALFFLTYVQGQCSKSTPQYDFLTNNVNFELTDMQQLRLSWTQLDKFAQALECTDDKQTRQCF